MKPYTNEEYVAKLRERNALSFVEDCRLTLPEVHDMIHLQDYDESLREHHIRLGRAKTDLTRLMLRIQDGHTEAKDHG